MMGDVPPPTSLYPSPPQPGQNALASNPAQVIGLMNGVNQLKLFNAQYPALAERPGVDLATAQMQQQEMASRAVGRIMGGYLAGIPKPTDDDVRSAAAFAARSLPNVATQYPDIISAASETGRRNPGLLINSGLSPEGQSQEVAGTPTAGGAETKLKIPASNMGTARVVSLPQGSEDSSRVMQGDLAREGSYASDINPLKKALDLAQKLGPGGMAPGSKGRQEFESFVYGLMPQLVPASMQDKIKNYAELEKYLVNNASQRAQALGPHTNEGLATATTGSPNVHINDLAGVDLIKAQLAIRNMEHAQVLQAAKVGGPNYTAAKAAFSSQHDPRAYMINMMSPDEIKNLQTTLKGADRAKFNQSLKAAIDSGVIERP
jgi:hypothetical protein